jgi:Phosphatidylserine/phosphatidylglycerophosphate/cardiolipin synthases and related enzymes
MKSLLSVFVLTLAFQAHARVEALFHPFDPTLEKIAQWISEADQTVDIAMYNMETGGSSPVILALKSPMIQKRLASGQLKIRVIFEGYGPLADRNQKMQALESLGIDVRYLGKSVKVHHKFAVIDSRSHNNHRVISGSANWSLSSYRNYNENILFFESEKEITAEYQNEFTRLWNAAREFGKASDELKSEANELHADQSDIRVHFNSGRTLDKSLAPVEITEHLVELIDQAQSEIAVASTRIRRTAILEALQRAADRGVQIRLVISQDDYQDLYKRAEYLLNNPNIQLRVKLYSLKVSDYMTYQMHNKFMIMDGKTLFTGSFNWSDSSEYNHIENVVELSGNVGAEVIPSYTKHFTTLWNLGRDQYAPLLENLKAQNYKGCAIPAMALSAAEAKVVINLGRRCGVK